MQVITLLCMGVLTVAQGAHAAEPVAIPEQTSLLGDQARTRSIRLHASLSKRVLRAIQSSARAQVAILISSGIGEEPLSTMRCASPSTGSSAWAKRDDGLLIVIVPSINAARIEVGYGLEGDIPDARASRWIDELLPAIKNKELAAGLSHLLDEIDATLPAAAQKKPATEDDFLFPDHPEWRLPFVLAVFSLFAVFPLMFGRWGSIASAALLAAFYGGAAWALWSLQRAGFAAAGIAFPLPLLWGLNWADNERLPRALQHAKSLGNLLRSGHVLCDSYAVCWRRAARERR